MNHLIPENPITVYMYTDSEKNFKLRFWQIENAGFSEEDLDWNGNLPCFDESDFEYLRGQLK